MSLGIQSDREDLQPLVHLAATEALDCAEEQRAQFSGRLAFAEAALRMENDRQ